ncbi:MAG: WbuC family cupin fold metalloprotein [Proteobacteria bacterium]|nr:WbuC family cupin fold metalloprotein [Pseudomonadota bacterium]
MVKCIDNEILTETSERAKGSPRLRMNYNFHELSDPVQRMLNAIEPESYISPHRHSEPEKMELFLVLRGRGAVIIFDDAGRVTDTYILEVGGDTLGVEIPPGVWHSILSLEEGTVFFEVKDGPYIAATDKDFAPWAPAPGDESVQSYLKELEDMVE